MKKVNKSETATLSQRTGDILIVKKELAYQTKDELIKELLEFKQKYDSLKTSYSKDISEFKQAEETLSRQKDALLKLNDFSIGLSKLTFEDNLEAFIARKLKELTGAKVTIFSEYNQTNRTINAKHIEIKPGLLKKVISLLGQQISSIHSEVNDEMYKEMSSEIIGIRKTLYEASFGAISRQVSTAIQALLKVDRFIGLAYLIEGKLYGTSLLTMSMDKPNPPREILENFISIAALSLRRKLTEKLLKESTERLNDAQKLAHIGVWNWKPDTDTVTWTDELYHIAGLDPMLPAPTYKEHSSLYSAESWKLLNAGVKKAMETGESYQFELELIRPNGDTRYVNAFGGAKYDSKGRVNGLFGTVQDITERKKVEKELFIQSEILKNITEGVLLIKQDNGIIVFTNQKFDEMFGYDYGEMIGKDVSILNAPTDKSPEETKRDIIDIISRTGEWHGEILNTKKNGEHFWCYANVSEFDHPVFGKVHISVHSDITDRKQIEASLIESEARFRRLFENSLLGISIARPGAGLLQVNLAYARMYGYENPEVLLAEVHDTGELFAKPEERKEVLRELQMNGFMEPREFELIRRDGSHFFVLVSASEIRDSEGKLLFNMATHIDLTDRKKDEEKIHAASLHSRNLIEASLDPLVTINAEGKVTDINKATEQITGIKREKLIGSDFADYFTEPDKARKGYRIVFKNGVVKDYALTILHKNGREIDVLYNATLFRNEVGEVKGVFAAVRNITGRKKIEKELQKSKELLERLNQHLNDVRENERAFISREIHDELGQSMTALKLDLNQMYKYVGTNPEAIMRLNSLIELASNTIKNVQRISSDLRPGILDDLGLVSAIEWYSDEFEKRTGIKCRLKLDDSIVGDPQKNLIFFRVLQESLTNVIRHANASSVTIELNQTQKGITLAIKDNGIGIKREEVESTKSLGLIGMRERVRQFGGKIVFSPKEGSGTKLTVFIPDK